MSELAATERELIASTAQAVVARRMAAPAMMFLETITPMNVVTSSMLHVMSPLWCACLPASRIDDVARLLERREAIPELIRAIDEAEHAHRSASGPRKEH